MLEDRIRSTLASPSTAVSTISSAPSQARMLTWRPIAPWIA
jgi:hypothetical protein